MRIDKQGVNKDVLQFLGLDYVELENEKRKVMMVLYRTKEGQCWKLSLNVTLTIESCTCYWVLNGKASGALSS